MNKTILISVIFLIINTSVSASLSRDEGAIGNKIKQDEYPESQYVEPVIVNQNDDLTIKGGVENTLDINIEECLKYALGNNPRIQSAMQDVFASDSRIRQTWAAYFPQFSWQTGYSRIRQLQLSDVFNENLIFNYWVLGQISASQMLYDFGVTQNQVTIRKLDNLGYRIILTGTINDVVYQVKNAYYALQYAVEAKKVAEENVKNFENFYEQAKAFYRVGVKPKVDVTIAEVNLSNAKLTLIQTDNAVFTAMAELSNKMGLPYSNKYNISDCLKFNPCDITLDKAIEISQESRPEFQLADIKVEQAKQNVRLVQKSYFPQITIEGQFQIGGQNPTSNYGYNWGGYFNFPTINAMLIKHEIREAQSLCSKEKSNAINTKNNIYLDVQTAYYSLREKKNQIPVAYLSKKQAKENYDLSCGRYSAGVGNSIELRDAQNQYANAQLTYYKTLFEYNSARANLEKSIGKNLMANEIELDLNYKTKKNKKNKS